ncbi:MAG: tetratricopeptide repeat protein, partial [Candidatus Bathyarchaeota archaeon]|nr:tetratricopeptide repeat protein [Candidatus Bathyarchaeota archaeon]
CLGEYDKAIRHYRESFKINEKIRNDKEKTFNLENLSEVCRKTGDHSGALEYGRKGLKLASAIDFTERVGRILKDLGVTHFEMGEYQEAYAHFQQAREVAERIKDRELQILVLIALTGLRIVLNDRETATQLLEEACAIIKAIGDEKSQISVHQIRSLLEKKEGRFEEASKFLDEAVALAKRLGVGEEILSLNLEYADLYLDQGDPAKCEECLRRATDSGLERFILLQPLFHLISGRAKWVGGDLKSARADFQTALGLAQKLNQPDMIWQIQRHLGKLFLTSHDVERAYQELRSAGRVLMELSEGIEDEEMSQNYLRDPRKKELLCELKAVAKQLIGEAAIS